MSSPSHPGGPSGSLKQTDGLRAMRERDGSQRTASVDSLFIFITVVFVK